MVVEDDKLQTAVTKAIEQAESVMPSLTDDDFDLENLEVTGGDDEANNDSLGRDDVEDAPIVRFVNKILLDAIKKGASDIHFEPYEKIFRIRTRLDGVLKEVALPPVQLAIKIVARLKVMARLDIAERRVPQDGRIKMRLSKKPRHRLSRQHLSDAFWRKGRHPYSRPVERNAWHRCLGL